MPRGADAAPPAGRLRRKIVGGRFALAGLIVLAQGFLRSACVKDFGGRVDWYTRPEWEIVWLWPKRSDLTCQAPQHSHQEAF